MFFNVVYLGATFLAVALFAQTDTYRSTRLIVFSIVALGFLISSTSGTSGLIGSLFVIIMDIGMLIYLKVNGYLLGS